MSRIDKILETIDGGLYEASHDRHLNILRDITSLALMRAQDPNDTFDFHDASESIETCEKWVETKNPGHGRGNTLLTQSHTQSLNLY